MNPAACPTSQELSQAFSLGADDALTAHLAQCQRCAAEWSGLRELKQLGKQLPYTAPQGERRDDLRAELLLAARQGQGRPHRPPVPARGFRLAAAAALLLLVGIGLRWFVSRPHLALHGTIHPLAGARFDHLGPPQDEIVRLMEGTILIEVDRLRPGERFRVLTGDGEVEVRGTVFETTASHDSLSGVRVLRGKVEVRPPQGASLLLGAGERWQRPLAARPPAAHPEEKVPAPAAPPSPSPAPVPSAGPRSGPSSAVAPSSPGQHKQTLSLRPLGGPAHLVPRVASLRNSPSHPGAGSTLGTGASEQAFDEGWSALRAGHYGPAADAFARAIAAGPDPSIDEDARFWRGVATARAGRRSEAMRSMRDFLDRYPSSARSGEASSMLGWLILNGSPDSLAGLDEAARRFDAAALDRSAEVRDSARGGLAAVAAHRARARAH